MNGWMDDVIVESCWYVRAGFFLFCSGLGARSAVGCCYLVCLLGLLSSGSLFGKLGGCRAEKTETRVWNVWNANDDDNNNEENEDEDENDDGDNERRPLFSPVSAPCRPCIIFFYLTARAHHSLSTMRFD